MDLTHRELLSDSLESAASVLERALAGDVDAQFTAGLIYAEGRGVEVDLVQAFYWLTQAVEQGDEDAGNLRLLIGADMSDEEYDRAVHLIEVEKQARLVQKAPPGQTRVLH